MYKVIVSGFVVLDTLFWLLLPVQAQETLLRGEEAPECTAALRTAQNTMTKGRNVTITGVKKTDTPQQYQGYPQNRPSGYLFLVKGTDAQSVLLSSKLLVSLSRNIIKNCQSVSLVEFQLDEQTDFITTVGLVGQDKVEVFSKCGNPEANTLPWGHITRISHKPAVRRIKVAICS